METVPLGVIALVSRYCNVDGIAIALRGLSVWFSLLQDAIMGYEYGLVYVYSDSQILLSHARCD